MRKVLTILVAVGSVAAAAAQLSDPARESQALTHGRLVDVSGAAADADAAFAGAALAQTLPDLASRPVVPAGLAAAAAAGDDAAFAETRIEVPKNGVTLALRDMTGDGRLELVRVDGGGVLVRRLGANDVYEERGALMPWPGTTVGWDLVDLEGTGRTDLVMVADGRSVQRVRFAPTGAWGGAETLFETNVYLPAGVARVPFGRDVDGDGRLDLVLPGSGRFHIRVGRGVGEDGTTLAFGPPVEVGYEPEIDYELGDPTRLSSTFGQVVRVPWFSMLDVDGDGRQDLVSEMGDRVSFHLARPEIDALPTWELDLSALKNSDDVSASDIDLDDLLSVVSGLAQWRVLDLDGVAPNDLVIGSEGTFKVYLGGAVKGPVDDPDQVLKASGNALYFFVRDVMGDPRPDLQIVRGERISLGRLLKYLVVPGKVDFDVFTYQNEGGTFARRPSRRTTLALRIPRILDLVDRFDEISDQLEAQWDIPAQRLDWDGDGAEDDVVDAQGGALVVFVGCAPPEQKFENLSLSRGLDGLVEKVIIEDLDRLGDGGENVIDLGELEAFAVAPGQGLRNATQGREPVATFPLWEGKDDQSLRSLDLNGDGRLDVLAVGEGDQNTYRIQLLVRR